MQENTNSSSGNQNGHTGAGAKPTLSWSQPNNSAAKPSTAPVTKTVAPVTTPAKGASQNAATNTATSSSAGTYVGIFVAGAILGLLIGWGLTSGGKGTAVSTTATSTESTTQTQNNSATATNTAGSSNNNAPAMGQSGNVNVPSPQQAGFAVAINNVTVSQPTWLVVYEDHNGTPGNAIGAGLFFSGTPSGTIELLRATLPGQSYFVGQSLDDGDKIFSLASDKPVRDEKGNPLFTEFTAQ